MLKDSDYVLAHSQETFDESGAPMGVRIYIASGRKEPTEDERKVAWRAGEQIFNEVWRSNVLLNEQSKANAAAEREYILRLFTDKSIFVEEIPYGYCQQPCCSNKRWFIVTTHIGHIMIGWRKRVINIDWTKTIQTKNANELFPNEDVTKSGDYEDVRYIHAWGYEKAKEYLDILHKDI